MLGLEVVSHVRIDAGVVPVIVVIRIDHIRFGVAVLEVLVELAGVDVALDVAPLLLAHVRLDHGAARVLGLVGVVQRRRLVVVHVLGVALHGALVGEEGLRFGLFLVVACVGAGVVLLHRRVVVVDVGVGDRVEIVLAGAEELLVLGGRHWGVESAGDDVSLLD